MSEPRPARDLVRRRARTYRGAETGRQHHLGEPPPRAPVHTEDGVAWTETTAPRLRELPLRQLDDLAAQLQAAMTRASEHLDFEGAAGHLAELRHVQTEQARRAGSGAAGEGEGEGDTERDGGGHGAGDRQP